MELDRHEEIGDDDEVWSVSKLQTLDSCGRKFQLQYIDRIEERKTAALTFGSVIHRLLEDSIRDGITSEGTLQRMFDDYWHEPSQQVDWDQEKEKQKAYKNKGQKIIFNFLNGEHFETLKLEHKFRCEEDGLKLTGVIDRVVKKDGELAVIDYKTSRNPPDSLLLARDFQLSMYWRGVQDIIGEEVSLFGIYHLLSGEIHWTSRVRQDFNDLAMTLRQAQQKVDMKMFQRNVNWTCRYCPFKEICLTKS